ncbi:hypothetical protein CHS0354_035538, partial [Potamilus streckersoni]
MNASPSRYLLESYKDNPNASQKNFGIALTAARLPLLASLFCVVKSVSVRRLLRRKDWCTQLKKRVLRKSLNNISVTLSQQPVHPCADCKRLFWARIELIYGLPP